MVRSFACSATLLALSAGLLALPPPARAQAAPSPAAAGIDCQMLARLPNAPMTVQTCEQRMAVHLEMMSALETPGGARPDDERMTCEAIAAELRTLKVSGVSAANTAEGQAAGQAAMSIMQRAMAEGMGLMAGQTARSAAAAAVPGNAAGHAAAMANQAEQKALQDRTAGQMGPARERMEIANTNATADLVRAMRANPRFARLLKLGGERNCQG
jgi:hypothetical protein